MQRTLVTVNWRPGLHLRPASRLVALSRRFKSEIRLRVGNSYADARSILALLLLSAGMGAPIEVEASGDDERDAISAVQQFFGGDGEEGGVAQSS